MPHSDSPPTNETIAADIMAWLVAEQAEDGHPPVDLAPDTALMESGILDSVRLVQLVSWLEESYGIQVTVDKLTPEHFATPRTLAALVTGLKSGG